MGTNMTLYITTNAFAVIVLSVLLREQTQKHADKYMYDNKLFAQILMANITILIFDTFMWVIDGQDWIFARELNLISSALYYIQTPVLGYLWLLYAYYKTTNDWKKTKKLIWISVFPIIINTFLAVSSIWTGWYFSVSADNVYSRGGFGFFVYVFLCYIYLVLTSIVVVKHHRKTQNNRLLNISLAMFPLPALIASVLQTFFYGLSIIWAITALSLLLIFLNFQNQQITTDYLTGLFNRRQLEYYIRYKPKRLADNGHGKGYIIVMMIDIDGFKKINDRCGHNVGDNALENAAAVLRACFRKEDFLARYGGDEFVAIIERDLTESVGTVISLINENTALFNSREKRPYELHFSIGCEICEKASLVSLEQALKNADTAMYNNKNKTNKES